MTTGYTYPSLVIAALAPLFLAPAAHAWEFRCRFVERVGTTDIPLAGDTINASDLNPHRIRIRFGVFDDATSPAPAGGFVGWNLGSIAVSGPADNSDERRTNGRISPFNFAPQPNANGNPPLPAGDPFTILTDIDATLGSQSPIWMCGPDGQPLPMPPPIVRGLNVFSSVYEVTIDPRTDAASYSLTCSGSLLGATSWEIVGTPTPPRCDGPPCGPIECPGELIYAPVPTPPESFTCTLQVIIPSPASAPILLALLALAHSRRRRP